MFQGEKPTERRSLPPARRSPGPRSRDAGHSLQMAQMMDMMKAMTTQLQEVKSQVGKLQQDRDPFPFRPVVPYDDDDEDDFCVVAEEDDWRSRRVIGDGR